MHGYRIDSTPNTHVVMCLDCLLRPGVSAWQGFAFSRLGAWEAAARHEVTCHPSDYLAREHLAQYRRRHPLG